MKLFLIIFVGLIIGFGIYFVFIGTASAAGNTVTCSVAHGVCQFSSQVCESSEVFRTTVCSQGEIAFCEAFLGEVCGGTVCGGQGVFSEIGKCQPGPPPPTTVTTAPPTTAPPTTAPPTTAPPTTAPPTTAPPTTAPPTTAPPTTAPPTTLPPTTTCEDTCSNWIGRQGPVNDPNASVGRQEICKLSDCSLSGIDIWFCNAGYQEINGRCSLPSATTLPPATTTLPPTATTLPPTTVATTLPPPTTVPPTTAPPTTVPPTTTTLCPWWNPFCTEPTTTTTTTIGPPPPTTIVLPPTTTLPNRPPSSKVTVTEPDYCSFGPAITVSWAYSDPDGDPQGSYQVQIDDQSSFNSPEIDSGRINSTSTSYFSGTGILQFNTTYRARVKVWDSRGASSAPLVKEILAVSAERTLLAARCAWWDPFCEESGPCPWWDPFCEEPAATTTTTTTTAISPGTLLGMIPVSGTSQYIRDPSGPTCSNEQVVGGFAINYSGPITGSSKVNQCNPNPFYFAQLPAGTYTVSVTAPLGWEVVGQNQQQVIIQSGQNKHQWWAVRRTSATTTTTLLPTTTTTTTLPPTTTTLPPTTTTTLLLGSGWTEQTICNGPGCAGNGKSWKTPKHAYPQTNFSWNPFLPRANQQIQFSDASTYYSAPAQGRSWSWTFGDGGSSNRQNPAHVYSAINNYTVNLTARDQDNYSCSASKVVIVKKPVPIWKEIAPKE